MAAVIGGRARSSFPRRLPDRIEDAAAWLLATLALLATLGAALVGQAVYAAAAGEQARTDRVQVTATVLEDAPPVLTPGPAAPAMSVRAAWTAPDGPHTGQIVVAGQLPAGSVYPIWVDLSGRPVPAPPSTVDAVVSGVALAMSVLVGAFSMLAGLWWAVRAWTRRLASAAWEREWAAVEPRWSRRGTV
ncbi:Rv1733c family protein [Pseudonocardia sp.]|uniref:Rv1733c family protein n=1 Tax=Pseudonocardia sp. TaxID=60912 RepID=UPI003D0A30DD